MTPRFDFAIGCGPEIGMGHLSRALTLASALAAKGAMVRLFVSDISSIPASLPFTSASLDDGRPQGADMLIIDGVRAPGSALEELAKASRTFAFVDDVGHSPITCDVLINQNIYGSELAFDGYSSKLRLLGPSFALVRPAFADARSGAYRTEPRVLVTFGGGITGSLGLNVAQQLSKMFAGPIDVALGSAVANPIEAMPPMVAIVRGGDMPGLMARATLYVGSLGVTFLEALTAGLPAVVAAVAPDQRLALEAAQRLGVDIVEPGTAEAISHAAFARLQNLQAVKVDQPDGQGAQRVADALFEYLAGAGRN
jgi:spore coat polysaccharide biosynthesis predicted glycosyltransferase SpsG